MPLTLSRSDVAARRAVRARPFYEPGYFGPRQGTYGSLMARAADVPTDIGGMPIPLPGPGLIVRNGQVRGTEPPDPDLVRARKLGMAYNAPPLGVAGVGRYGVGQLQNYGVGALAAYSPLMREENLRWRS